MEGARESVFREVKEGKKYKRVVGLETLRGIGPLSL